MGNFDEADRGMNHIIRKAEGGYVLQCTRPGKPHITDSTNHKEGSLCTGDGGRCGYTLVRLYN